MRRVLPVLFLAACWVSPEEIDAVVEPGSAALGDIEILSVTPDWGTSAGGSAVTVEASPLGEEVRVWFGEAEAEVASVDGGAILLTAPAGVAGPAEVRVESGSDVGVLSEGFTYWEDAAGSVAVVGEHSWFEPIGYFEGEPAWGASWLLFHEPAQVEIRDYFGPALDTCQRDHAWDADLVEAPLGADQVQLRGDTGHTFTLGGDSAEGWFEKEEPAPSDWTERAGYDLLEIDGSWPAFTVEGIAATPAPLTVYTPDLDSVLPAVSVNTSLAWSTAQPADFAVAYLVRYEGGDDPVDRVTCTMADDGSFQVPGSVWSSWSFLYTDVLVMYLGRVQVTEATLPHTGATTVVAGSHWVVGAAVQGL